MRSSRIWGIIKAEVCVICRSRRLRQITQTEALIIPHILRELNSIIVLLFICIYIGLRVNACIVNKGTQAAKPFVFSHFWHKVGKYMCFQYTTKLRHNVVYVFSIFNSDVITPNLGNYGTDMAISSTALNQSKLLNYFQ